MAVFKCETCGSPLKFEEGQKIVECEYCGTVQTLPRGQSEIIENLYDRAGHFRRNNDYDKARALYEKILEEDSSDSKAYWCIILCKYGVEYVYDEAKKRHIPTLHRMQKTSIFADEDYKSALKYAEPEERKVYEHDAKVIDDIARGFINIAEHETPFDIFLCYKESDENGNRTEDSVLAEDIYNELTEMGYKVFFSKITLESKLGVEYEPYIFSALESSKIMIVIGTKQAYIESTWVKNEWSRFLALSKREKKTLIPAYKHMSPYDLPEEFSHLQGQDMSKLGFMQDLTRGVKKIMSSYEKAATGGYKMRPDVTKLIKRIRIFLNDEDYSNAYRYVERALDEDPENGELYYYQLLARCQVKDLDDLNRYDDSILEDNSLENALRYSQGKLHERIDAFVKERKQRNFVATKKVEIEGRLRTLAEKINNNNNFIRTREHQINHMNENIAKERTRIKAESAESKNNLIVRSTCMGTCIFAWILILAGLIIPGGDVVRIIGSVIWGIEVLGVIGILLYRILVKKHVAEDRMFLFFAADLLLFAVPSFVNALRRYKKNDYDRFHLKEIEKASHEITALSNQAITPSQVKSEEAKKYVEFLRVKERLETENQELKSKINELDTELAIID